ELNSILASELMDISDCNCWRLSRCDRVVRCRKRCHPHELLKSRGREHEEIVILDISRIAQLMRDPARSHESIARPEYELLISNNDFQFSGHDKVGLVLTRVSMPRHANARCEIYLQQAVCSPRIRARQAYRTDGHIEEITARFRLMLDRRDRVRERGDVHEYLLCSMELPREDGPLLPSVLAA